VARRTVLSLPSTHLYMSAIAATAANQVGAAVGVETSGVYTPSTIKVWCHQP
jgi:hypothetical protein